MKIQQVNKLDGSKDLDYVRSELEKVSPTFCLAKWLESTIHFHIGKTHSCHHNPLTQINIEELKKNPSALHNTKEKLDQRKMLLNGTQPAGCDYCWKVEKLGPQFFSDRMTKSSREWAATNYKNVVDSQLGETIAPTSLEVSFSNECQFKCSYCSADFSSRWEEEINKFGPYPTENGGSSYKIKKEDSNEYIKHFWMWWPELVKNLKIFRITGGEPLLSKNTFLVLDKIFEQSYPKLELGINSNFGSHENVINNFNLKVQEILEKNKISKFYLFTSIDTFGEQAEYIRNGLNFEKYNKNINNFLKNVPKANLAFMITFNIFSAFKFLDLLKWIMSLKKEYPNQAGYVRVTCDINYLRHPELMSAQLLPKEFMYLLDECYKYMCENLTTKQSLGFSNVEVEKMKNLVEWVKQNPFTSAKENNLEKILKTNFFKFFNEHDRRRNTDLQSVFPELVSSLS